MSDQYLVQLRSTDPEVRRAAIIALADSPDPKASEYLARVAKTDPSTALRMLAERAQRHSLRKSWRSIDTDKPSSDGGGYLHAERANAEINDVQRRARSQIFNAQGSSVNGDIRGALGYLVSAFELDPSLMRDQEAMRLTAELTGQPVEDATRLLMAGVEKKQKREAPAGFWTLMGYISLESVFFFLLLAGLAYLILWAVSHNALSTPSATADVRAQLASLGGPRLLLNAAEVGGVLLLSYYVYFAIMFGVAMMMGGFGTIFDFVNVMLRVYIVLTVANLIILGIVIAAKPLPSSISGVYILLLIINTCIVAYFAAREMKFGFMRGVATVFAPQILACMILLVLLLLNMGQAAVHFFSGLPS